MKFADIIIDISSDKLDRPFGYIIPPELEDGLNVGDCVNIPFGKGDTLRRGYVIGISDKPSYDISKMKSISSAAESEPSVEERAVRLAAFIRKSYGGTMNQALSAVLPIKKTVKKLVKKRIVRILGREEIHALRADAIKKKQVAKERLLAALLEEETIPYEWVTGKLSVSAQTVLSLEKNGVIRIEEYESYRNPVKINGADEKRVTLSPEQESIIETVSEKPGKYLIRGITGSGKTEVYMALTEKAVAKGKQVIFLIPEIALTYQTLMRFYSRFGERVSVLNSTLSAGERFDQCMRAKEGALDVIIGPRSALFTPFPDIGLIIMDEEHETSYNSESVPKYHTREVAEELARITGATLVVGSATPSVDVSYAAERGEYKALYLTKRLTGGSLPNVHIADLREELRAGNRSIFSRKLKSLMDDRMSKGEQMMLFLNRRGSYGVVSCRECGEALKCPHCDVTLSEHYGGVMKCHYCGYETEKPSLCPKCGSKYLAGFRIGTETIEEKLKGMYPDAGILRMDRDTTQTKDSYEKILSAFKNGEAQILIGTQMIVKGHDFPGVTLVGVLAADLSLGAGDYRASERTFDLLVQAVGRSGRGDAAGEAVIQTYQPDNYAVKYAAMQDYESFYRDEKEYRLTLGYPPTAHMLAMLVYGRNEAETLALARRLPDVVNSESKLAVMGPAPAFVSRINDVYRYVIYIKNADREVLEKAKDRAEEFMAGSEARNVHIQFDFDPTYGI